MELKERDVTIINSVENGKPFSKVASTFLAPNIKIIALGQEAFKRCQVFNETHKVLKVSHPQHAKRFYGKNALAKYVKELKHVLS